jgi:hypothetical protein
MGSWLCSRAGGHLEGLPTRCMYFGMSQRKDSQKLAAPLAAQLFFFQEPYCLLLPSPKVITTAAPSSLDAGSCHSRHQAKRSCHGEIFSVSE